MNFLAESENYRQPYQKLNVVTLIVIDILGKARAHANEIVWRRNAILVNLDFLDIIRSLFTSENTADRFPSINCFLSYFRLSFQLIVEMKSRSVHNDIEVILITNSAGRTDLQENMWRRIFAGNVSVWILKRIHGYHCKFMKSSSSVIIAVFCFVLFCFVVVFFSFIM